MRWMATVALVVGLGLVARSGPITAADGPANGSILASSPGHDLLLTVGDDVRTAHVTREGLSSNGVTLTRFPGRLAGHVGVESVDLRIEPGRLEGQIGDRGIGLDVVRAGDVLQVMGTFGARSVAMEVRHNGIHAQIGPCWYSLSLISGSYRGSVACGARPQVLALSVPVAFVAQDDVELAAMLTALLAR